MNDLAHETQRTESDLQVRVERALEHRLTELRAIGDLAEQKLHHHRPLVHRLLEAGGDARALRRLAKSREQVPVGLRVVELHRLELAHVEHVARPLRIRRLLRERELRDELLGQLEQRSAEQIAQQQVHQHCLTLVIIMQRRTPQARVKLPIL